MSRESVDGDLFDDFLETRGHSTQSDGWKEDKNKFQCPECGGIHDEPADECTVCGWRQE